MECPFETEKNTKRYCTEKRCAWWVELNTKGEKGELVVNGKCAMAWIPILLIEIRMGLEGKLIPKQGGN
jgi:hypothetical protein